MLAQLARGLGKKPPELVHVRTGGEDPLIVIHCLRCWCQRLGALEREQGMSQKLVAGFGVARFGRCKLTGQNVATGALQRDCEPMIAQNVKHTVRDVDDFRSSQLLKDRSAGRRISTERSLIKNIGPADRRFRFRRWSQASVNEEAEERRHGKGAPEQGGDWVLDVFAERAVRTGAGRSVISFYYEGS